MSVESINSSAEIEKKWINKHVACRNIKISTWHVYVISIQYSSS